MSRDFAIEASGLVARSLRISRTTRLTVAAIVSAVALNASVAIQFLGAPGQGILLVLIFVSVALGLSTISMDLYSRSSQAVNNLRSIGATRKSISYAVIFSMIGYGAAGAVVGAVAGTGVGAALGSPGASITSLAVDMAGVVIAASTATMAGVYVGGSLWRS